MSYLTPPKKHQTQREIEDAIDQENCKIACVCCIPLCIVGITHGLWMLCIKVPYDRLRSLKNRYREKKNLKQEQKLKKKQDLIRKQNLNRVHDCDSLESTSIEI